MSVKEKSESDEFEWTAEDEVQLFLALDGKKPVGINKNFYMAFICEKLAKALDRDITSDTIWTHLKSMYNLSVLDKLEPLPFPNERKEFLLPDDEFSLLMKKKESEIEEANKIELIKKATDLKNDNKEKSNKQQGQQQTTINKLSQIKELEKKVAAKIISSETAKRTPKRTRGSMSLESNSPSTTPPPTSQSNKRRRI